MWPRRDFLKSAGTLAASTALPAWAAAAASASKASKTFALRPAAIELATKAGSATGFW